MTYADSVDLLTGSIPVPAYVDKAQALKDASDEVDSYLASAYVTPIVLAPAPAEGPDEFRQTRLILKRITAQLASGRIITAAAAGGEDTDVHAYGRMLMNDALTALRKLATGEPALPGAVPVERTEEQKNLPIVTNGDPYSLVDAFYEKPGAIMVQGAWPPVPPFVRGR